MRLRPGLEKWADNVRVLKRIVPNRTVEAARAEGTAYVRFRADAELNEGLKVY
jgi:hypothetical protein